jgi:hypothetical protein
LSKRAEKRKQQFSVGRGCVHLLRQRLKSHAPDFQVGDNGQQVGQGSPKAVELPNDQGVAFLQVFQTRLQAGAIIPGARCLIGIEMAFIDAGGEQSIALEVDRLAVVDR